MSSNDRHLAALAWAVESAGLDRTGPIDSTVVSGPSNAGLEAARRSACSERESAESRRDRVAASLDRLRRKRAAAVAAIADAEQAASEATERRQRLEADADAALERLAQLETRLGALTAELEQAAGDAAVADALHAGVQRQIDLLSSGAVSVAEQHDAAERLTELAAAASALGLHDPAGALATWSNDLSSGTAALQPRAVALLGEFGEFQRRWEELGSGDLERAPVVIAAQTELDTARVLFAEIEAEARSGGLGQRARARIDAAQRHRQSIEAKGKKADPAELSAAIDAETTALRQVGFDSILDYRVAMSTGGSGALVDACRRSATDRVSRLEPSLEAARHTTSTTQQQLRNRLEALQRDAEELTGDAGDLRFEQALRGCLDTPSQVRTAIAEIQEFCATMHGLLQRGRAEVATLQAEHRTVEQARSLALAEAARSADEAEHAAEAGLRAHQQVNEIDHSLIESTRQLAETDRALVDAAAAIEQLAGRRYLQDDVRSFSDALIAVVAGQVGALTEDGATSVVIDDPLGGFDDDDAVAVLDDLIDRDWSVPVLFVTSRPKLVGRLRRPRGRVRGIDGRRRVPGQQRWRRRHPRAAAST